LQSVLFLTHLRQAVVTNLPVDCTFSVNVCDHPVERLNPLLGRSFGEGCPSLSGFTFLITPDVQSLESMNIALRHSSQRNASVLPGFWLVNECRHMFRWHWVKPLAF
jgi:hypothetical protein